MIFGKAIDLEIEIYNKYHDEELGTKPSKWSDICIRKSMMEDFEFCPMRFKKTWLVDKAVNRDAYIMRVGTRFHEFAERFFNYCDVIDIDDWEIMIPVQFSPSEVKMAQWFVAMERRRYKQYNDEGRIDEWRPIAREIQIKYDVLSICGTIDRVDWYNRNNGEVAIIEYKTGFSFYKPTLLRQLAFYTILWEQAFNMGKVVKLIVINPRLQKIEEYDVTPRIVNSILKKLIKLRNMIRADDNWPRKCWIKKFIMCRLCTVDESGLYK